MDSKEQISIDDFAKLEIKIGTITSAEKVPDADTLLRFTVDVGEEKERTIVSGVAAFFPEPHILVGRQVPVVANLAPRTIRGIESAGMILYVVREGFVTTLEPGEKNIPSGTRVQ